MKHLQVCIVLLLAAPIILEMIVGQLECAPLPTIHLNPKPTSAMEEYRKVKAGLQERKREMCSFLLNDLDSRDDEKLDLDKVTRLFEASLEHLAKTTSYVTLMKPYLKREIITSFDASAGAYVLEVSDTRRKLIEEYESAEAKGLGDQEKRDLLEGYFYKACESKLSTIVTEKSMFDSAQKAEKLLRIKLINDQQ